MLDDGGDIEGIVVVKEVYQGWVNSRWGSESVGHFWYFEGVSCIVWSRSNEQDVLMRKEVEL